MIEIDTVHHVLNKRRQHATSIHVTRHTIVLLNELHQKGEVPSVQHSASFTITGAVNLAKAIARAIEVAKKEKP